MPVSRPSSSPRQRGLLRIGEFAALAGVSRPTVAHWVAEGLLPRPRKSGRTMAWYDPAWIERVRLIQEMQSRYLPLAAIRRLLERPRAPSSETAATVSSLLAAGRRLQALLEPAELPLARDEVPAHTGLADETVAELERLGLVRAAADGKTFAPHDAAVLRAVGRLSRAGLDAAAGFRHQDLLIYRDAVNALIGREVELFTRHLVGKRPQRELVRLAGAAAAGATELIAALHRKLVADFLAGAIPSRRRRAR